MIALSIPEAPPVLSAPAGFNVDTQRKFVEALSLVEGGDPEAGVAILRDLYQATSAPRIRLELARALMLIGDYAEARRLFVIAIKENPPPVVKANIRAFLNRIDTKTGKFELNFSVAHYGNPLQQPNAFAFNFGGVNLTYSPDQADRNLWGATLGGQYKRQFDTGWSVSSNASYRVLQRSAANRLMADFAIGRKVADGPVEVQVGISHFGQLNQSFNLPYVQLGFSKTITPRFAIQPNVKAGYYASSVGSGLTGWHFEAGAPLIFAPNPTKTFAVGPIMVRHAVAFAEQSYTSSALRAVASVRASKLNIEGGLQARVTSFDRIDPFWGTRRTDKGASAYILLSSDSIRFGRLVPNIGGSCELNHSNVNYYQQRNCDILFEFRKLF